MADAQDLGSCTERCRGSTPLSCIRPDVSARLIQRPTLTGTPMTRPPRDLLAASAAVVALVAAARLAGQFLAGFLAHRARRRRRPSWTTSPRWNRGRTR